MAIKVKDVRTTDCDVCAPELQIGVTNNGEFFAAGGEGKMLLRKQKEREGGAAL